MKKKKRRSHSSSRKTKRKKHTSSRLHKHSNKRSRKKSRKRTLKKNSWKRDAIEIAAFLTFLLLLRVFIFAPLTVESVSMEPTLVANDRGWVLKILPIKRFDIINFHVPASVVKENPDQKGLVYVKRVIGLPGDSIEFHEDTLYINGKKMTEPYLDHQKKNWSKRTPFTKDYSLYESSGMKKIPEDKYLLLGDNRQESYDGREFGLVDKKDIIGVLKFRYWPFNKIGLMD